MQKEAFYFFHDSNAQDDPKCVVLMDHLGAEGYGIFWLLVERLRNEKDYTLPLAVLSGWSKRWGTSKEKIEAVIKNYGLFVVENERFYSPRLKSTMEERSAKARESINSRWHKHNNTVVLPPNNDSNTTVIRNDTRRGEERRREEKRGEENSVGAADAAKENGTIGVVSDKADGIRAIKNGSAGKKNDKPRAAPRKKKDGEREPEPHWQLLRRVWVDFNLRHIHFDPEPIPKEDYSFMRRIIEQLRTRTTHQKVEWTEQQAIVRWEKFLATAYNDNWLNSHFELSHLNSQKQRIINLSENGKTNSQINGAHRKATQGGGPVIDTNATSSGSWT